MQSFQEQDYTKRFDLSLWRKLIKVAKPYHKNLIAVVLFMAVTAIIDVIMPNMNAYAIDVFIANHSTAGLVGFVVAYALLTAVQVATIFGFLRQCCIVETGTCYLIRKLGFQKLCSSSDTPERIFHFMSEITQKRTRCLPHPRFLLLTHAIHRLLHWKDFKQHAAFALGYAREHDLNGFRVSQGTAQFGNGRIGNKLFVLVGKTLCPLTHMGEQ